MKVVFCGKYCVCGGCGNTETREYHTFPPCSYVEEVLDLYDWVWVQYPLCWSRVDDFEKRWMFWSYLGCEEELQPLRETLLRQFPSHYPPHLEMQMFLNWFVEGCEDDLILSPLFGPSPLTPRGIAPLGFVRRAFERGWMMGSFFAYLCKYDPNFVRGWISSKNPFEQRSLSFLFNFYTGNVSQLPLHLALYAGEVRPVDNTDKLKYALLGRRGKDVNYLKEITKNVRDREMFGAMRWCWTKEQREVLQRLELF